MLRELIDEHGKNVISSPQRLKSLVRDYACGEYTREVNLWLLVVEEDILHKIDSATNLEFISPLLTKRLHDKYGTDQTAAAWAISSWFHALKGVNTSIHETFSEDHKYQVVIPTILSDKLSILLPQALSVDNKLEKGMPLFTAKGEGKGMPAVRYKAPYNLTIVQITNQEQTLTGQAVLTFACDAVISSDDRHALNKFFWERWLNIYAQPNKATQQSTTSTHVEQPKKRLAINQLLAIGQGKYKLPFKVVAVKVLHNGKTAVLGGEKGQLAAVNLTTGELIDSRKDGIRVGEFTPGGGEINYPGDCFYYIELLPEESCFVTVGHDGNLKKWRLHERLFLLSTTALLKNNFFLLKNVILAEKGSWWPFRNWSSWRYYRDIPPNVPRGILAAKLSPDCKSIVCLTEWFAIFRSTLEGQIIGKPVVIPDAFAIEPGNEVIWVGIHSKGLRNGFCRLDMNSGKIANMIWSGEHSFLRAGIYRAENTIFFGYEVWNLNKLKKHFNASNFVGGAIYPSIIKSKRLVVSTDWFFKIFIYELDSLHSDGASLEGHDDIILSLGASPDGSILVSVDEGAQMIIWDLDTRRPISN
ncbi:hypothetical protein AT705_05145 [Pseudoalteromonas rubra]|uniref:Uncharacterized protein n=2 Tax=Pseudoalteromonas rubra TaxID=43658 RepID=A0A0U3GT58_9GAMM|nr:hypothetical protein AT705_05145 [Pseudoalteromonas rubra]